MSDFRRTVRQTMTVARRDFVATVFTPTFLIFLLAPLIMLAFGSIGALGGASMAGNAEGSTRLVLIAPPEQTAVIRDTDTRLRTIFNEFNVPPPLTIEAPAGDVAAQAKGLMETIDTDVKAVLHGPLDTPTILYGGDNGLHARYLASVAEQALRDQRIGDAPTAFSEATLVATTRETSSIAGRGQAAFFTVFGMFMLTLLLAGQVVGSMAEERSNKVIEVLAAAVPLESVFLGKLVGMFGVALLFIAFWGGIAFNFTGLLPEDYARRFAEIGPAIGLLPFALLFLAYFTMAYMLLGAVFLGIGAQASTPREIQMLSLPITIFQVAMFGLSAAAAGSPDSWFATFAEVFPFSSPFAMGAKAANDPALWPHFAALAWQLLWVAITVSIGARLFRRGVLQSAGPKFRWASLVGR